jgi:hypothetical protein
VHSIPEIRRDRHITFELSTFLNLARKRKTKKKALKISKDD